MKTTSVTASISRKGGGLPPSIRRLDQCLNEIPGVKTSVAAFLDEDSERDKMEWSPVPVTLSRLYGSHGIGFAPGLLRQILGTDADIVHTHGLWQYTSRAVSQWHRQTGRPYVISPHGMLDPWAVRNSAWKKRIALTLYEQRHLEEAACIRALCEAEAQAIRQFGLQNPICIIPNGIDVPEIPSLAAPDARPPWSDLIGPGKKILLYLGRIHPKKGLDNLLQAWAQLQKSGSRGPKDSEWILAIAGWDQGGHEFELKERCRELKMKFVDSREQSAPALSSVLFLGPQFGEAKTACYARCDAFILPSFSEGLPMVVLEAWAFSKPVLMSPECNLPEGFAAGAASRVDADSEKMAGQLLGFLSQPESDIKQMGLAGRSLVDRHFNWPLVARGMSEVYQWLLGKGTQPTCVR